MKILSGYVVLVLLFIMFTAPSSFSADERQSDDKSPIILADASADDKSKETPKLSEESWISNGEKLGEWWLRNPKKFDPVPAPLLYHFEANYSYSELGGNIDGKNHNGDINLTLRKQLFTSTSDYHIGKSETTMNLIGMATLVENQNFVQNFSYAFTDWMQASGGIYWSCDSAKYFKNRLYYYGGADFALIERQHLVLNVGGFYSYLETEYWNDEMLIFYPDFEPIEDYTSDYLYFTQMLQWNITDTITFTENATYMQDIDDTDYYNWKVEAVLKFNLTKHFAFFTSYSISYDNNTFVEAVQNYIDENAYSGEMETTDTVLAAGINFSF